MATTFVTTTAYGSWLPGGLRGDVEDSMVLPGSPKLLEYAATQLNEQPVLFSVREQRKLFDALCASCEEFQYRLTDASTESWHLHWIVRHDDAVSAMGGRLKNR